MINDDFYKKKLGIWDIPYIFRPMIKLGPLKFHFKKTWYMIMIYLVKDDLPNVPV